VPGRGIVRQDSEERKQGSRKLCRLAWASLVVWVCVLDVGAWGAFSGGSGVVGDPYLISIVNDLRTLSADPNHWDKHFKMTGDLDLTGVSITPIGHDMVRSHVSRGSA